MSSYVNLQSSPVDTTAHDEEVEHGVILYRATFSPSSVEKYVSYISWLTFWMGLLLIFAYGLGIFLILYIPVIRTIARRDIETRRLYVTSESIVYKTYKPAFCPCLGFNKQEKHVLLPLVTDIVLSQSWFERRFGITSIKVENAGQTGGDQAVKFDLQCQGIDDPSLFKRVALMAATHRRNGHAVTAQTIADAIRGVFIAPEAANGAASGTFPFVHRAGAGAPAATVAINDQKLDKVIDTLERVALLMEKREAAALAASEEKNLV